MTNVTPLRETIQHHLGNAAQIAECWASPTITANDTAAYTRQAFGAIRDHLKAALQELGEANLEAIHAARILVPEYYGRHPDYEDTRALRDTVAGILHAQVTGNVPPTWSKP